MELDSAVSSKRNSKSGRASGAAMNTKAKTSKRATKAKPANKEVAVESQQDLPQPDQEPSAAAVEANSFDEAKARTALGVVELFHHMVVAKTTDKKSAKAELSRLDSDAKVEEIARMLGGVKITDQSRAHAEEMLAAN